MLLLEPVEEDQGVDLAEPREKRPLFPVVRIAPVDPGAPGSSWGRAIAWTAVMSSGAAIGRLVSRYAVGEQLDKRMGGQRELQKA